MKHSKLLLVEDNQEAADLIIAILEYAGYEVVHKETALEGLKAAQSDYFDGILLDYMLPDIEGLQLCRLIRESLREVPIILTTAYVNKVTEEDMLAAGITAFVPKPLTNHILNVIKKYVKTQSSVTNKINRSVSITIPNRFW
jgi:two-component system, OmpR family, response regulator